MDKISRQNPIVSEEEWLDARLKLLSREKEFNRLRDELSRDRQALPFREIKQDYIFDAEKGQMKLKDLFCGKNQLIMYHFMYGESWESGCPSCSFWADNFNGISCHLRARDAQLVFCGHASLEKLQAYRARMKWNDLFFVSSLNSEFNYDFHVTFTEEEMKTGKKHYNFQPDNSFPSDQGPGVSIFYREGERVFHTYSTFSRGLDMANGAYHLMDMLPKGRDEAGLPFGMSWLKRNDEYVEEEQKNKEKCCCCSGGGDCDEGGK